MIAHIQRDNYKTYCGSRVGNVSTIKLIDVLKWLSIRGRYQLCPKCFYLANIIEKVGNA